MQRPPGCAARGVSIRAAAAALCITCVSLAGPLSAQTKPRVHVIATGGTISNLGSGSGTDRRSGTELVAAIPGLAQVAHVTVEQFSNIASGAITHDHWRRLAARIGEVMLESDAPAGIVITHGTDTMEETAFFLDLTTSVCAPIVLTGAMRQADAAGADGPANLLNAVRVAAAPQARGHGVLILMNDELFRARDATKANASRMDAFVAPDAGPLGVADPDSVVVSRPAAGRSCSVPLFDLRALGDLPRVDVIYAHVGTDSVLADAAVAAGARGLVVAGVGRGGMPPALNRAVRRAVDSGVVTVVSSRTGSGRVGRIFTPPADNQPGALPRAGRGGVIAAQELNPQKARILLMLALASGYDVRRIEALIKAR
ncbi:MAG: asparaginase [Gemmatimonadaceae bacterium]